MRFADKLKCHLVCEVILVEILEEQCNIDDSDSEDMNEAHLRDVNRVLAAASREHERSVAVHNAIFRFLLSFAGKPEQREMLVKVPHLIESTIEAFNTLKRLPQASHAWGWEFWGAWTNFSAGVRDMQIRILNTPGFMACLLYGVEVQAIDGGCCRRIAAALRNLNENNDEGDDIIGAEAARPLYVSLVRCLIRHRNSPRVVEVLGAAMCNMCMSFKMRTRFVELGPYVFGILTMVLVQHVECYEVVKQLGSLISNICRGENSYVPRENLSRWDAACVAELSRNMDYSTTHPSILLSSEELLGLEPCQWQRLVPTVVYAWRQTRPNYRLGLDGLLCSVMQTCVAQIPLNTLYAYPAGVACMGAVRNIFGGAGAEPLYKDVAPDAIILKTSVEWLKFLIAELKKCNVEGATDSTAQLRAQCTESVLAAARNLAAACSRFRRTILLNAEFMELVAEAVILSIHVPSVCTQGSWLAHEIARCRVMPPPSWVEMVKKVRAVHGDKSGGGRYATSVCAMVQVMEQGRVKVVDAEGKEVPKKE